MKNLILYTKISLTIHLNLTLQISKILCYLGCYTVLCGITTKWQQNNKITIINTYIVTNISIEVHSLQRLSRGSVFIVPHFSSWLIVLIRNVWICYLLIYPKTVITSRRRKHIIPRLIAMIFHRNSAQKWNKNHHKIYSKHWTQQSHQN